MASRTVYEVAPAGEGWTVKKQGAQRAGSRHDTKDDAVSRGMQVAKNARPSQLIIKKADGTVQEERTYPRSSDPYPPRG